MPDPSDFELQKEPQPGRAPAARPPSLVPWIVAAVLVIAAAAAFFLLRRDGEPPGEVAQTGTEELVPPAEPLGVEVEPVDVPPLDESDAFVRDLVRALSSHPRVAAWLTTDGLIRNFAVVVENIARGQTPSGHLRVLKPKEPFEVIDAGGALVGHPRNYDRYNDLAAAVASIDADGAAKLYSTLKPRIEEAHRELGYQGSFDQVLETAIVRLLEVPVVEGEIALVPSGAVYDYNDPRIERLTQAQKQLVRMGPRNVRTVHRKLRQIALALGIPPDRLP